MTNLQAPLWRSIAAFRFASLAYAAILLGLRSDTYSHWGTAWAIWAGMTAWTIFTTVLYASPARRTPLLLAVDLLVTALAVLSTALVQYPSFVHHGAMPVTATWLAGPALSWAVMTGVRAGAIAAITLGACTVALRHLPPGKLVASTDLDGPVVLLMAAMLAGYMNKLTARAEEALQRVT